MFTITKQFHFSAAHKLRNVPAGHPCGRQHGHNYVVEMVLESATLMVGLDWVRDFGDLSVVKDFIDVEWDHRDLNEWMAGEVRADAMVQETTAEVLAMVLYDRFTDELPELAAVRVSETPKTWAEYRGRTRT